MVNSSHLSEHASGNLFSLSSITTTEYSSAQSDNVSPICYQHLAYSLSDPVLFFQSIGDSVSGTDIICIDYNPAARRFFKQPGEALFGISLKDIPVPVPLAVVSGILLQALLTGETRKYNGHRDQNTPVLTAIPLSESIVVLHIDILHSPVELEKVLVWDEHVQTTFNNLLDCISDTTQTMKRQSEIMLVLVMELTQSRYGALSYLDPVTGDMKGHSISDGFMKGYSIYDADMSMIFPSTVDGDIPGLIGRAQEYGKPFFLNRPDKTELFQASDILPVDNFMFVPIIKNTEHIGFVALGNCESDFSREKLDAVIRLVRLYSIALERWQYEHGLAEREAKYQALLETAPVMILIIDAIGKIIDCNPFAEKYLGYSREVLLEKPFENLIHPDFRAMLMQKMSGTHPASEAISCECRLLGKYDSVLDVIVNVSLRRSAEKKRDTFTVICQDISQQKESAAALAVSEEKFRMISEQSYMGIAIVQNKRIIYANDAYAKMCEYSREEMSCWDECKYDRVMKPVALDEEPQGDRCSDFPSQVYRSYSVKIRTRSGIPKWFEVVSKKITYKGESANLLSILDISERVKAETKLRFSLTEKEVLLKEIHHRVKNNLQVISSLLNLQSQYIGNKKLNEIFKESQHRIKAMALIHEKLYASDNLVDINFPDYLRSLAFFLVRSYQVSLRNIELVIEIDEIFLGIDFAVPCGIILNELLSNSLKYAFPDSFDRHKRIMVILRLTAQNTISFTISDNGVGIPEKIMKNKASSLGLELVKILAEGQLDGTVTCDREEGTRFCIVFPKPVHKQT